MLPRLALLGLLLTALPASVAPAVDGADTAWVMTTTARVLFYGGLVRVRNVLSVLM